MKLYYAAARDMACLDQIAVQSGLEIRQMMELAGWHMVQLLDNIPVPKASKIAIIVGKGNKGGDGLSAARHLINYGYNVDIFMMSNDISHDANHHLNLLKEMNSSIKLFENQSLHGYDVIIDSLIGYRLNGAPKNGFDKAIDCINDSDDAVVISYDLPSGIDATNGETPGKFVKADFNLMLALAKSALSNPSVKSAFGTTFIADIGIPKYLYDQIELNSRPVFASNGLLAI